MSPDPTRPHRPRLLCRRGVGPTRARPTPLAVLNTATLAALAVVATAVLAATAPGTTRSTPPDTVAYPVPAGVSVAARADTATAPTGPILGPVGAVATGPAVATTSATTSVTAAARVAVPTDPAPEPAPVPVPVGSGDSSGSGDSPGWLERHVSDAITWFFRVLVGDALNPVMHLLGATVMSIPDPAQFPALTGLWSGARAVAVSGYLLLVLAGALIVACHETLQTRTTIKQVAPRLVVGFVALNLSLWVVGQAVTLSNALCAALMSGVDPQTAATQLAQRVDGWFAAASGQGAWLVFIVLVLLVMAVVAVIGYVVRFALLGMLTVIGPLALACHALPQTEKAAAWWWRALTALLLAQLGQSLTFAIAVQILLSPGARPILPTLLTGGVGDATASSVLLLAALFLSIYLPIWVLGAAKMPGTAAVGRLARAWLGYQTLGRLTRARRGSSGRNPGRGYGGGGGRWPRCGGPAGPGPGRGPRRPPPGPTSPARPRTGPRRGPDSGAATPTRDDTDQPIPTHTGTGAGVSGGPRRVEHPTRRPRPVTAGAGAPRPGGAARPPGPARATAHRVPTRPAAPTPTPVPAPVPVAGVRATASPVPTHTAAPPPGSGAAGPGGSGRVIRTPRGAAGSPPPPAAASPGTGPARHGPVPVHPPAAPPPGRPDTRAGAGGPARAGRRPGTTRR